MTVSVTAGPASACVAMVCAGASAWLLAGTDRGMRRARLLLGRARRGPWSAGQRRRGVWPDGATPCQAASLEPVRFGSVSCGPRLSRILGLLRRRTGHEVWCLVAGAAVAVPGRSVLPLLFGIAGTFLARRAAKGGAAMRAKERRTEAVIALCGVLAGEVRAGRHPGHALLATAGYSAGLGGARAAVLAAARFGGDVPLALRRAAREPGAEGLAGVAACWRVAVDSGAGLAAGLERLESALRAQHDQRAELRAQLAGARSTAVLLAGLPVLGLLLGGALGADPLRVLLHTGAGLVCLLAGGVLEAVGLWWSMRIVRTGEGV